MYKRIIFSLSISLFLISCDAPKNKIEERASTENILRIDGEYESTQGDLKIQSSNGKVEFNILIVSNDGRTGDLEGRIILDGTHAVYKARDCQLRFNFLNNSVDILQEGSCEMGFNVTASGTYKRTEI